MRLLKGSVPPLFQAELQLHVFLVSTPGEEQWEAHLQGYHEKGAWHPHLLST